MKRKPTRRNILLTFDSNYSSSRRVASGALRRIAEIPDWDVTMLNFRNRGFQRSVRLLSERQPFDGVISDSDIPLSDGLSKSLRNAIFVNAVAPSQGWTHFGCVVDNAAIAEAAASSLMRLKPRHFAYVGARAHEMEDSHSRARERRFRQFLAKKGLAVSSLFVDDDRFSPDLAALLRPVGIFAYNDITAAKVLSELHALGVQVPEQAAVIGVDNDPDICENTRPPLSSVDPDFETAGRMAVEVLSAALSERRRIPILKFGVSGVVERRSTQSGKTGSRMVSKAREILRRRYGERLSLELIAGELNISPRLLSLRFREITGGTVHAELEEIRLAAARRMLKSRTLPVKAVAAACGFPSLENFYRRYRRRYGTTPRSA